MDSKFRIQIRMTPQERDLLTEAAKHERRSLANFLLAAGLAAANKTAIHWADCVGGK